MRIVEKILKWIKKYNRALILILTVLISLLIILHRNSFLDLTAYGYLGLFILSVVGNATIILPVPAFIAAFVGGAVFNPLLVALIFAFGGAIGELTGYLMGYGAKEIIKDNPKYKRVENYMNKFGLWTIFVFAATPLPLDLAGIVAGASELPVYKYFIIVFLGKIIKYGVLAYLGANSITTIDKFL